MERIIIIGCGGSGKSTLARQLGEKLNLPVVHLDKLFWRPGWVQVSAQEFDALHEKALRQPKWIMDGNFNRTLSQRLEHCDTAIYLDFSRTACMLGVLKRIITTYGVVRPDMGEGCPERIDWDFLKWVWNFRKTHRPKQMQLLHDAQYANVIILKNRRQVRQFLESLT